MERDQVTGWSDTDSRDFLEHGELFVPRRQEQIDTIVALLPRTDGALRVLELCCGAGLLAHEILAARDGATVTAIDGSEEMVHAARATNEAFGDRFRVECAAIEGHTPRGPLDAIVSSLAIHHLDDDGKRRLFRGEGWNPFALATPDPVDRPSPLAAQLDWLRDVGFEPDVYWLFAGHAVYGGTRR